MYLFALRGDVVTALEIADSYPDNQLSPEQVAEKARFYSRFRSGDDITFTEESKLANEIMTYFHIYWDKVLLQKAAGDQALNELLMSAIPYLFENYLNEKGVSMEDLQQDPVGYLSELFLEEGYHASIGYTSGIMDIYLWKSESRKS